MRTPLWKGLLQVALLAAIVSSTVSLHARAEEDRSRRDAAEVVKEGDVSHWLQHYQRERGEQWKKQGVPQSPIPRQREKDEAKPPVLPSGR
ncbi:MAG TPA: hypothetical protein VFA81_10465 [Burkholderiales bacterium]|nr:hypothetical protein [Burkholderiales bacterium]